MDSGGTDGRIFETPLCGGLEQRWLARDDVSSPPKQLLLQHLPIISITKLEGLKSGRPASKGLRFGPCFRMGLFGDTDKCCDRLLVMAPIAQQLKIREGAATTANVIDLGCGLAAFSTLLAIAVEDGGANSVRELSAGLVIAARQDQSEPYLDRLCDVGSRIATVLARSASIPNPRCFVGA